MNPIDRQLNRLFKSASQAPKAAGAEEPPFGLETRVMAEWRESLQTGGGDFFEAWFRQAAIGACLLAVVSLAWNYHDLTSGAKGISDELAIADSNMQRGMYP